MDFSLIKWITAFVISFRFTWEPVISKLGSYTQQQQNIFATYLENHQNITTELIEPSLKILSLLNLEDIDVNIVSESQLKLKFSHVHSIKIESEEVPKTEEEIQALSIIKVVDYINSLLKEADEIRFTVSGATDYETVKEFITSKMITLPTVIFTVIGDDEYKDVLALHMASVGKYLFKTRLVKA